MTTFTVIGNCQASPISNFITRMTSELTAVKSVPIHMVDKQAPDALYKAIADADVVVHQPIGDNFHKASINEIKKVFPTKKYISFPSIYFDGYFPSLMYLRIPGEGTLKGVIGDFHDRRVVKGVLKGINDNEIVQMMCETGDISEAGNPIDASLSNLFEREKDLDIQVAPVIKEHVYNKRLFYVFNHPCNELLIHVAISVCELLGADINKNALGECYQSNDFLIGSQAAIDCSVVKMMNNVDRQMKLFANRQSGNSPQFFHLEEFVRLQAAQYRQLEMLESYYEFTLERRKLTGN